MCVQIPIIADVPVGENLQDHVIADPVEFFTSYSVSVTPAKAENFMSAWAYYLFGTGKCAGLPDIIKVYWLIPS